MEENKTLNEMNSEQPINTETPVLENPVADMAPVAETPAPEVVAEVAPVVETPAPVSAEVAPVVETSAPEVVAEAAPATETPAAGTTPAEGTAAPVTEEKKKAPVNIVAVLIIVVCCVLGGYIIWSRSKPESTPNPTPNPAPVVTPSDDPNAETDTLNHPVAAAEKYTLAVDGTEYTVYLKTGTNNFYYLTNAGCISGNYGTYTEVDGTLTLQSEAYYNCESCYYTSADPTNGIMATLVMSLSRDAAANTLSNADGTQIFTFAGTEEIGNPFNLEGVHSCDNLENAN